MDPQHPLHQPFTRKSTFGAILQESGPVPLPPRLYGPGSLPTTRRSQGTYDPLGRRENELSPAAPPGPPRSSLIYPPHAYHHEIIRHGKPSPPPGPFASMHPEPTPSFHSRHSSRGSVMKSGEGVKEPGNALYREGKGNISRPID
ncbi:predicted protein [Histoplasma capsulatum G186AR]|uniref:Uncharacterized protein n=1 Tax=Ajellomyces capsulatus (strain G186AR / H82 / ATCC MYA-2454 / RMSCC 2432) TaxID=447093 RepID=C0NCZ2_AJECG|nr:uncharacterized protein HCBG_00988 [Histoplasma capsulatum G186AR]EEH11533.1 predicted protein [Histoplasma capsulatum G186AR]